MPISPKLPPIATDRSRPTESASVEPVTTAVMGFRVTLDDAGDTHDCEYVRAMSIEIAPNLECMVIASSTPRTNL